LARLMDSMVESTQMMANLQQSLVRNNATLDELSKLFYNGFRSDIRTLKESLLEHVGNCSRHVDAVLSLEKEIHDLAESVERVGERMDTVLAKITSPAFWIKIIFSGLITIGGSVLAVWELANHLIKH